MTKTIVTRPVAMVVVIVIFLLFILMQLAGLVLAIIAAPLGVFLRIDRWLTYTENLFTAADCAAAAAWGWDGKETISKKCAESDGALCKVTCWALSRVLERDHCEKYLQQ